MPEPFLAELNRSSEVTPGSIEQEYIQWQRGPLSDTPLEQMKQWVDTCLAHNNIWLVLVFHGVEGVGWEPIPADTLDHYFRYMAAGEDLWVATFRDVAGYMRERMSSQVSVTRKGGEFLVELSHRIDPGLYDMALTLKTIIPDSWEQVSVTQDGQQLNYQIGNDQTGKFITYDALPNHAPVYITPSE